MEDSFRKKVEEVIAKHKNSPEEVSAHLADLLRSSGISVKRGWVDSQLNPAVDGILMRTFGDTRLTSLSLCSLLEKDFQLGLKEKGLFENDDMLLNFINPKPPTVPRMKMGR